MKGKTEFKFVLETLADGRVRARSSNTPLEVIADDLPRLHERVERAVRSIYGVNGRAALLIRQP